VERAPGPLAMRLPEFYGEAMEGAQCASPIPAEKLPQDVAGDLDKCGTDASCLAGVARNFGVDLVLVGKALRSGDTFLFSVSAIDAKSGKAVGTRDIRYEGMASGIETGIKNNITDVCKLVNPGWTPPAEAALATLAFDDGSAKPPPAAAPKPAGSDVGLDF